MISYTEHPHECVLLVARNTPDAVCLERQLTGLGWHIHHAATGQDARSLVKAVRPKLVLLDVQAIDGESGWLTCAKLTHAFPQQRVILLADTSDPQDEEFAKFVGAEEVSTVAGLAANTLADRQSEKRETCCN